MLNKCCSVLPMALGKRIQAQLDQLGWNRKLLLEKVDGLTPVFFYPANPHLLTQSATCVYMHPSRPTSAQ